MGTLCLDLKFAFQKERGGENVRYLRHIFWIVLVPLNIYFPGTYYYF
jgi:hypothetical protein